MPRLLTLLLHCVAASAMSLIDLEEMERMDTPRRRYLPLPECLSCSSIKILQAPGVGFSLELAYGTAVIRYHDGTYKNVARIQGDEEYVSAMHSLAANTKRGASVIVNQRPPDVRSYLDQMIWRIQHGRARRTTTPAFPASEELFALADMITKLKDATELTSIESIVLSTPGCIRLTGEELEDLTDHLRMDGRNWTITQLNSAASAYAGLGFGLCSDYLDVARCEAEELVLPRHRLLHIDVSEQSLSANMVLMRHATARQHADLTAARWGEQSFATFDLEYPTTNDTWTDLRRHLRSFEDSYLWKISKVIFTGSSACDTKIRSVIRDALWDAVRPTAFDTDYKNCEDLLWATARGAAEFSKRRQEGPVECRDSEECKRRRESHRSSMQRLILHAGW